MDLRRLAVSIAESAGWLTDVRAEIVEAYLHGRKSLVAPNLENEAASSKSTIPIETHVRSLTAVHERSAERNGTFADDVARRVLDKRRILLADDDLGILFTLKAVLEINGFEVDAARSAQEAIAKLHAETYHLVITEMKMEEGKSEYDVIRAARETAYNPAVALLTAYPLQAKEWSAEGAQSMLVKPINTDDLLRQVEALLSQHEDQKRVQLEDRMQAHRLHRPRLRHH